jgi:hypothetical protein
MLTTRIDGQPFVVDPDHSPACSAWTMAHAGTLTPAERLRSIARRPADIRRFLASSDRRQVDRVRELERRAPGA